MTEENYKSAEQVSDEDYKVAPTSADRAIQKKASSQKGGRHELPSGVEEELKEGVE
jgi:hypothetical protein